MERASSDEFALPGRPGWSLFLLAAITLFAELALIRWTSANVIYLGYFSNFILLACFLGIGVGFLLARRGWDLLRWSPAMLLFLVVFTVGAQTELALPDHAERVYFGVGQIREGWLPTPVALAILFGSTVALFAMISQATGRCFPRFEPLKAYTIDILGSMTGIVFFSALSFFHVPAWIWFAFVSVAFVAINWRHDPRGRLLPVACALLIPVVVWLADYRSPADELVWSPYQLLTVHGAEADVSQIRGNRVPHQVMTSVKAARESGSGDPTVSDYDKPYLVAERESHHDIEDVLIIGAGSGTDVAHALAHDVNHIDAVEIDPVIANFGERLHPDAPYADERVNLVVDDGRHFLETTDQTYDLIVYALPDSLALLSSYSSVRLESFLFTEESIRAARERLNDGGFIVLYNFFRNRFVLQKLGAVLERAFGHPPQILQNAETGLQVIIAGETISGPPLRDRFSEWEPGPLPTDDWPFLYMREKTLPTLYLYLLLPMFLLTVVLVKIFAPPGAFRTYGWPFFFMGAAFLLLETKSIIQFSLLFGATWLVNSLVFFAVLAMVLLANWLVMVFRPKKFWPWYLALATSLAAAWFIPLSELSSIENRTLQYVAASTLTFAPIFLANVIFSRTFTESEASDVSFGWNILGTMVGGGLEYASLALGYQSLIVIVALLYLAAVVTFEFQRRRARPS